MIETATKAKIAAGEVSRSAFLDKHGMFAKEEEQVDHVNLEFEDGSTARLTAADFDSLTDEQQDHIRDAGALGQEA